MPLNRTSCHWIGLRHWIGLHVIGWTLCYCIIHGSYILSDNILYVIGSTSCRWIIHFSIWGNPKIWNPENRIRKTKENKFFKSGILRCIVCSCTNKMPSKINANSGLHFLKQISYDICTRFARYLYSSKQC